MNTHPDSLEPLLKAVQAATEDFGFCPNRVWAIAKNLPNWSQTFPQLFPSSDKIPHKGNREDHELCTFDFCEQSHIDFTFVKQRHESLHCHTKPCKRLDFSSKKLERAVKNQKPTSWAFNGSRTLNPTERYMAISHVWSDGTGAGSEASSQGSSQGSGLVNTCLLRFFQGIARQLGCGGIWWDAISIPTRKDLREQALKVMHRNFEGALVTLVHDRFLREWEWIDAESACFAIIMSPWFSRGWTALELQMSQTVKFIFKGPDGPIVKDLDNHILAIEYGTTASPSHHIAKDIILKLRQKSISNLNDLLGTLGSRHTSWPRDMAIISGLMTGIDTDGLQQQKIYQRILQNVLKVSHTQLFHNSATMSNGYNWCPTNLFDLPVTSSTMTLDIDGNGNVFGKWNIIPINAIHGEKFIWNHAHPLIEAKTRFALQHREQHVIVFEPHNVDTDFTVDRALVVRPVVTYEENSTYCYCEYIGPVYFHPPLEQSDVTEGNTILSLNVHIGSIVHNTAGIENAWHMILGMKKAIDQGYANRMNYKSHTRDQEPCESDKNKSDRLKDELFEATKNGDQKRLKEVLAQQVDVNQVDDYGWTAIHHAVWNGQEVVAKMLIKRSRVDFRTPDGEQAIHLAAERGNETLLNLLLEGSTPSQKRKDGRDALHLAAGNGSGGCVEALLRAQWDINAADSAGQTALHIASVEGHLRVVRALLQQELDITTREERNRTSVPIAAAGSFSGILELGVKAEIECKDQNGKTPLHLAAEGGHEKLINLLIDKGARLECQDALGQSPLYSAIMRGDERIISLLIDKGVNLEHQDSYSRTLLYSAIMRGDERIISLLINKEANLEHQDSRGMTPLYSAIMRGDERIISLLINKGANLEHQDSRGRTPLYSAVIEGDERIISLLINKGANLEHQDSHGMAPLYSAIIRGDERITSLLIDKGASLKCQDALRQTPLHIAVIGGYERIISLLINKGANLECQDTFGQTPLYAAAKKNQKMIVKLLIDKGANPESQHVMKKLY